MVKPLVKSSSPIVESTTTVAAGSVQQERIAIMRIAVEDCTHQEFAMASWVITTHPKTMGSRSHPNSGLWTGHGFGNSWGTGYGLMARSALQAVSLDAAIVAVVRCSKHLGAVGTTLLRALIIIHSDSFDHHHDPVVQASFTVVYSSSSQNHQCIIN